MTICDRLIVTAPGALECRRAELPPVGAGMVAVETTLSLVSPGTELRVLHGHDMAAAVWAEASDLELVTAYPPGAAPPTGGGGRARFPATLGYNSVGVVERVGDGMSQERVGQRVMTLARHQSRYAVAAWEAVPVPAAVAPERAAFAYLATLGLHALRRADYAPGQRVAVLGAGVVGALAALVARAVGAAEVALVEPRASRRERLRGIDGIATADPATAETELADRFDVVIEAAGGAAALGTAMRLVAPGGAIAVVALHPEPLGPLFAGHLFAKQPRLVGCANDPYASPRDTAGLTIPGNVAYVLELLRRELLPVERLVTHRLPAPDAATGYAVLADPDADACGVLLDWSA